MPTSEKKKNGIRQDLWFQVSESELNQLNPKRELYYRDADMACEMC